MHPPPACPTSSTSEDDDEAEEYDAAIDIPIYGQYHSKDGSCGCSIVRLHFIGIPARAVNKVDIPYPGGI